MTASATATCGHGVGALTSLVARRVVLVADRQRLEFVAHGVPRPQGSLTLVNANRGRGKPYLKNSDALIRWRNVVVDRCIEAVRASEWERVEDEPVALVARFTYERPKSHTKRQAAIDGGRKDRGGDLDKLVRAIGDALTAGGAISDDKLITDVEAFKRYAGEPGTLDRAGVEVVLLRRGGKPIKSAKVDTT